MNRTSHGVVVDCCEHVLEEDAPLCSDAAAFVLRVEYVIAETSEWLPDAMTLVLGLPEYPVKYLLVRVLVLSVQAC